MTFEKINVLSNPWQKCKITGKTKSFFLCIRLTLIIDTFYTTKTSPPFGWRFFLPHSNKSPSWFCSRESSIVFLQHQLPANFLLKTKSRENFFHTQPDDSASSSLIYSMLMAFFISAHAVSYQHFLASDMRRRKTIGKQNVCCVCFGSF